jgi:nucleotide-binding universal stress UspA family protein
MKILLATDGSDTAAAALDFVQGFPFPEDTEITLLTVMDEDRVTGGGHRGLSEGQKRALRETTDAVRQGCEEILAKESARLRDAGWAGKSLLRTGQPADEITRVADELDVDLVVVGSHGLTGIKRYLLGSVSSHVLQYAPCSVLIVKGTHHGRAAGSPLKILLAYDESPSAEKAVDFCSALPLGEQVEVTVLSVMPLVKLYRQDIAQQLSWLWQQQKRATQEALERVTKEVGWATPRVSHELRESGDVAEEILETAKQLGCDLLVAGHKGKGAIERFLIGSMATRLAHHAECSVLAVRRAPPIAGAPVSRKAETKPG